MNQPSFTINKEILTLFSFHSDDKPHLYCINTHDDAFFFSTSLYTVVSKPSSPNWRAFFYCRLWLEEVPEQQRNKTKLITRLINTIRPNSICYLSNPRRCRKHIRGHTRDELNKLQWWVRRAYRHALNIQNKTQNFHLFPTRDDKDQCFEKPVVGLIRLELGWMLRQLHSGM